jgi:hypothetical protein
MPELVSMFNRQCQAAFHVHRCPPPDIAAIIVSTNRMACPSVNPTAVSAVNWPYTAAATCRASEDGSTGGPPVKSGKLSKFTQQNRS